MKATNSDLCPIIWKKIDTKSHNNVNFYYFWKYLNQKGNPVYQVTSEDKPPENYAGYFDLNYLYKVKGFEGLK